MIMGRILGRVSVVKSVKKFGKDPRCETWEVICPTGRLAGRPAVQKEALPI